MAKGVVRSYQWVRCVRSNSPTLYPAAALSEARLPIPSMERTGSIASSEKIACEVLHEFPGGITGVSLGAWDVLTSKAHFS